MSRSRGGLTTFGLTLKGTILEALDSSGSAVKLGAAENVTNIPFHLSPQGLFEFIPKSPPGGGGSGGDEGTRTDETVRRNHLLVYSNPIAFALYGNVVELLFGDRKAIRFSVALGKVAELKKLLEALTGELNVRREVERMSSVGWFTKRDESGGDNLFRQRQNHHFSRPQSWEQKENDKLTAAKRGSRRSADSEGWVPEPGLKTTVTIITLLDAEWGSKLPRGALYRISLQVSKDGIFRFFTRPVSTAEGNQGGEDSSVAAVVPPPKALVYCSPIAVAIYGGGGGENMCEVLFRNLNAVRFRLEVVASGGAGAGDGWGGDVLGCIKRGIMAGMMPNEDYIPLYISEMKEKGWFNGAAVHLCREGLPPTPPASSLRQRKHEPRRVSNRIKARTVFANEMK